MTDGLKSYFCPLAIQAMPSSILPMELTIPSWSTDSVNSPNSPTALPLDASTSNTLTANALTDELVWLRQELQQRDQLIEQLSHQLYESLRYSIGSDQPAQSLNVAPALEPSRLSAEATTPEPGPELAQQIGFYQQQIANRDAEVGHLRVSNQELVERNQMLEKVIQELPDVYRQKFAERLAQVKAKMEVLQQENKQLRDDLQQINTILGRNHLSSAPQPAQLPPMSDKMSDNTPPNRARTVTHPGNE